MSRLIVIFLGHGHKFGELKEIQDELNAKILDLSPQGCSNYNEIPIMTAGNDIGDKSIVDLAEDQIEGMIVQDTKGTEAGIVLRQVIYESKFD